MATLITVGNSEGERRCDAKCYVQEREIMNFKWNGNLAEQQDRVFCALANGSFPSADDFCSIRGNWIVLIAAVLAPSNLTVRHYCLLDMIENVEDRFNKIRHQCYLLTRGGLWLEGYSYWQYTKPFLKKYGMFDNFIMNQDQMFSETSWCKNGKFYPAPFGDVWDSPLECQDFYPFKAAAPVEIPRLPVSHYHIKSKAVRFNLHTETVNAFRDPTSFKYYTGYKNKYPTKWLEIRALIMRLLIWRRK